MTARQVLTVVLLLLPSLWDAGAAERFGKYVKTPVTEAAENAVEGVKAGIPFGELLIENFALNMQLEPRLEDLLRGRLDDKDFILNPDANVIQQSITSLLAALRKSISGCGKILVRTKNGYLLADSLFATALAWPLEPGASGQKRVKIAFKLTLEEVSGAAYEDTALREWAVSEKNAILKFGEPFYFSFDEALLHGPLPHPQRYKESATPKWYRFDSINLGEFSVIATERPARVAKVLGNKIQLTTQNNLAYQAEVSCEPIRVPMRHLLLQETQELDNADAAKYLEARSATGDPDASELLAEFHRDGVRGFKKDASQSFKMWQKASEQNSLLGAQMVARHLEQGDGVAKDFQEAFKFTMTAADRGDVEARAFVAHLSGTWTKKAEMKKAFRKDLEDVARQFPESPAGHLYYAIFLLQESNFAKSSFSTVAAETKHAAIHGSLKALAIYARVLPELGSSTGPDPAKVKERLDTCIKAGVSSGWLSQNAASTLRDGSLEDVVKLSVP